MNKIYMSSKFLHLNKQLSVKNDEDLLIYTSIFECFNEFGLHFTENK